MYKRWSTLKKIHSGVSQCNALSSQKQDYDLYLCLCIERQPIVTREPNDLEKAMSSSLKKIEEKNSNKSNYDLQKTANFKRFDLLKSGNFEFHCETVRQSAADIDEFRKHEINNLKTTLESSASSTDTNISLNRNLTDSLFFVTRSKTKSNEQKWQLPQDIFQKGETIKQAIKRVLTRDCGDSLNVFLYGSTPIGYDTFSTNSSEEESSKRKCRIFYFLGKYISGHVNNNIQHEWLNLQELQQNLPKSAYRQLSRVSQISQ